MMKCAAYTLEEAKAKLVNHLTDSNLHYIRVKAAYEIADTAPYDVHETNDEEEEPPTYRVGQGAAKRLRPISPRRPLTPSTICELAIRETVRKLGSNMPIGSGGSGGSGGSDALQDAKEAAREATKRALTASRHAQRLALSAAAAFDAEATELEEVLLKDFSP